MTLDYITLFPGLVRTYLASGLFERAQKKSLLSYHIHDLRKFGVGKRKKVDDAPYGGGGGMLLRPDALASALASVKKLSKSQIIMLTPQGEMLTPSLAKKLSKSDQLIFVAGRYEGFDERVRQMVDKEITIGDYVLTSGDLPALVVTDAILRFLPGFLGNSVSADSDSFSLKSGKTALLEYPQYTKPRKFGGKSVPSVLLSGDHKAISKWRQAQALKKTARRRPDLIKKNLDRKPKSS